MRKKIFLKTLALIVCFSILCLHVPGVIAAEKNVKKYSFKLLIKRPVNMFFSLFPFHKSGPGSGNTIPPDQSITTNADSSGKIKVTGGMLRGKNLNGD